MKTLMLNLASLTLSISTIVHAFHVKKQFYPAVVYLSKSTPSLAVIYFQTFLLSLLACRVVCWIFFGRLRQVEFTMINDYLWYVVTDTCLTFATFRDSLNFKFFVLLGFLVFIKLFHWLLAKRVDHMERSPNITFLFNFRVSSSILCLFLINLSFISNPNEQIQNSSDILFFVLAFEYSILMVHLITLLFEYILNCYDLLVRDHPWQHKSACLVYLELLSNFIKILIYGYFMFQMFKLKLFPLFMIRAFWNNLTTFKSAFRNWQLSRRVINQMNNQFPNATAEELAAGDNVCIICREEMQANENAKKLPCNHIFHVACLRSWFQRQQTCPTCRRNVLQNNSTIRTNRPADVRPAAANPNNLNQNQAPANQPPPANQARVQELVHFLNMIRQQVNQQQANQQQAPDNSNQNNNQPTGQTSSTNAETNQPSQASPVTSTSIPTSIPPNLLGFPLVPFLPPLPLFNLPSPAAPINLSALTDEQLRSMEGDSRQALEARVRMLETLRGQIDAIILQFQQYNQIYVAQQAATNTLSSSPPPPSSSSSSSSSTATPTASATVNTSSTFSTVPESNSSLKSEPSPTPEMTPSTSASTSTPVTATVSAVKKESNESKPSIQSSVDSNEPEVEQGKKETPEEIRQKRLRVFEQSQASSSTSSDSTSAIEPTNSTD